MLETFRPLGCDIPLGDLTLLVIGEHPSVEFSEELSGFVMVFDADYFDHDASGVLQ